MPAHLTSGYRDLLKYGDGYAVVTITGRSFLREQVLGMLGLVVAAVSGAVETDYIRLALSNATGIEVPIAPASNTF